jgi:hypothetical protein
MDESTRGELRAALAKHGPETVFRYIGALCAETAAAEAPDANPEIWECAATAAESAAASLCGEEEESNLDAEFKDATDDDETEEDEAEEDDEDEAEPAEEARPPEGETSAPRPEGAATPQETTTTKERRGCTMKLKDRRIGPWPSDTTHWRGRLCDEQGKLAKNGKLLSLFDDGVEAFEFPIKTLSIETLRSLGASFGDFWVAVEYYRVDDSGRMPRGRSRALHIVTPEAARKAKTETATSALALVPHVPSGSNGSETFAHVLSLFALMQERDERARVAAREEARIAHERYVADLELQKERERLATQRQIAEMEHKAKLEAQLLAKGVRRGAGVDLDEIRGIFREEFEEIYSEGPEPAAPAPPAPLARPVDGTAKLAEMAASALTMLMPLLLQKLGGAAAAPLMAANPEGVPNAAA